MKRAEAVYLVANNTTTVAIQIKSNITVAGLKRSVVGLIKHDQRQLRSLWKSLELREVRRPSPKTVFGEVGAVQTGPHIVQRFDHYRVWVAIANSSRYSCVRSTIAQSMPPHLLVKSLFGAVVTDFDCHRTEVLLPLFCFSPHLRPGLRRGASDARRILDEP
jgi:hypothetical protein